MGSLTGGASQSEAIILGLKVNEKPTFHLLGCVRRTQQGPFYDLSIDLWCPSGVPPSGAHIVNCHNLGENYVMGSLCEPPKIKPLYRSGSMPQRGQSGGRRPPMKKGQCWARFASPAMTTNRAPPGRLVFHDSWLRPIAIFAYVNAAAPRRPIV